MARSSRWNQIGNYLQSSDEQMCVVVQIESLEALDNLAAIARVEGVDGVFFGPADLSASMGLLGNPMHPRVQSAIAEGIAVVKQAGKAAGSLSSDPATAREYLRMGATFVAVGVDTTLLVRAATQLRASFTTSPAPAETQTVSTY